MQKNKTQQTLAKRFLTGLVGAAVLATGLIASPLMIQNATAQTAAPAAAATDAKPKAKAKKPPTPGQLAARERAKKCGAEWKAAKAAGKIEKGQKWPQYWSACNKRLKTAG
jgi:hypothetical protein